MVLLLTFCKEKKGREEEKYTLTSSAKKAAAAYWSWKARPTKFLVAPENFSKVRSQRKKWNEVKMSQNGLFLNLGCPTHLLGPLGQPRTPWRAAGQRWQSQRWPVDLIKLLKKKSLFLYQSSFLGLENSKTSLDLWVASAHNLGAQNSKSCLWETLKVAS